MYTRELSPRARRTRACQLLESVGGTHLAHKRPEQMSGGERQRVAAARALVNHPAIVLADEPTGYLDAVAGARVIELLCDYSVSTGAVLIVATHNPRIGASMQGSVEMAFGRLKRQTPAPG